MIRYIIYCKRVDELLVFRSEKSRQTCLVFGLKKHLWLVSYNRRQIIGHKKILRS
jgi:hypothetical protein